MIIRRAVGCLIWAALAEVAIDPATVGLAASAGPLWGVRIALPLLAGLALTRRYRDWPAAITLATIGAVLTAIDVIMFLIPVIGGILAAPDEFIAVHRHDHWVVRYPDGPPQPSQVGPILLGVAGGLLAAVIVWFAVAGIVRIGMLLRTWTGQLIGLARPSQRPPSSGGRNAPNSTG